MRHSVQGSSNRSSSLSAQIALTEPGAVPTLAWRGPRSGVGQCREVPWVLSLL